MRPAENIPPQVATSYSHGNRVVQSHGNVAEIVGVTPIQNVVRHFIRLPSTNESNYMIKRLSTLREGIESNPPTYATVNKSPFSPEFQAEVRPTRDMYLISSMGGRTSCFQHTKL